MRSIRDINLGAGNKIQRDGVMTDSSVYSVHTPCIWVDNLSSAMNTSADIPGRLCLS